MRRHQTYPEELHRAFSQSLTAIAKTIEMPVRYAGPGNWTVFDKPIKYSDIDSSVVPIPGTQPTDKCLIISSQLWVTFQKMFLWIEALCIHEWSMFSERVEQENQQKMYRGFIYQLLTDRPDNRRSLTWERNNVDLLLMENQGIHLSLDRKTHHKRYKIRPRPFITSVSLPHQRTVEPRSGRPRFQLSQKTRSPTPTGEATTGKTPSRTRLQSIWYV